MLFLRKHLPYVLKQCIICPTGQVGQSDRAVSFRDLPLSARTVLVLQTGTSCPDPSLSLCVNNNHNNSYLQTKELLGKSFSGGRALLLCRSSHTQRQVCARLGWPGSTAPPQHGLLGLGNTCPGRLSCFGRAGHRASGILQAMCIRVAFVFLGILYDLGFWQLPYCPLFVHGLALCGMTMCSKWC